MSRRVLSVTPEAGGASLALVATAIAAGVLTALTPVIGVVDTYDNSAVRAFAAAGWVAVLPGLLALVLWTIRPILSTAALVGAGFLGFARATADLTVAIDPMAVARPELFVETTLRALPFAPAAGAWALVLADLIMLVIGLIAARRLFARIEFAERGRAQDEPLSEGHYASFGDSDRLETGQPGGAAMRSTTMLLCGLVGAVVLAASALSVPYHDGYLADRLIPVGGGLAAMVSTLVLAALLSAMVFAASVLPPSLAASLLGGAAAAAVVPGLTAILARAAGAPVELGASSWVGLGGAVALTLSGLLTRVDLFRVKAAAAEDRPPSALAQRAIGGLGLLAAGLALTASLLPILTINGQRPRVEASGFTLTDALPVPFLVAAVVVAAAAVAALVPQIAQAGRAALAVVSVLPLLALAPAIALNSQFESNAEANRAVIDDYVDVAEWSAGWGLWVGVIAALVALAAAGWAVAVFRRTADLATAVGDDEELSANRGQRAWLAAAGGAVAMVAMSLPVHHGPGAGSSSLFSGVFDAGWGGWFAAFAVFGALTCAVRTTAASVAVACGVAAAAVVASRLVIPAATRAEPGFAGAPGLIIGWVAVALLVATGVACAVIVRRVRLVSVDGSGKDDDTGTPRRPDSAATGRKPRPASSKGTRT